jgi:carbon-monoxide dehydrogenase large subunit
MRIPIDAGSIRVDGQEVAGLRGAALAAHRTRIGMLFQGGALFDSLSVWRNISFALGGSAAVASRGTATAGSAVVEVAAEVLRKGQALAAQRLEAAEADLVFADGAYCVAGTDRKVTLLALAEGGALDSQGMTRTAETYPNGCHIAEVEIDPETGECALLRYLVVDDVGTVINPLLLKGQIHGGVAQGFGQVFGENILYQDGQLLTGSFADYPMPRASDFPPLSVLSNPQPTASNVLGVKGAGEAGTVGALPVLMSAVMDALRPHGVTWLDMPATPERVWRALNNEREARAT